jgi:C4-dicarboxylate-specific signal transduction histidine kinase
MVAGMMGARVQPAERVLVGLCHDLNDRLAVLHGMLHLGARNGSVEADAAAALAVELDRMEVLIARLRQLAREPDGFVEALIVPELLDEALALLAHHTDRPGEPVRVTAPDYLPPVRGDRAALRALLLAAAAQLPASGGVVACEHHEHEVIVRFPLAERAESVPDTVAALAESLAVRVTIAPTDALELRLRSLLAE